MSITEKSSFEQIRGNWSSRVKAWTRDRENTQQYGPGAPLFAERLWIPMDKMECALKHWNTKHSGKVVYEWPPEKISSIEEIEVVRAYTRHWHENVPLEETGIYQQMMEYNFKHGKVDRLESENDVRQRYKELDELYKIVIRNGTLSPRSELIQRNFREEGGILVHIGPDGSPYFGGKGHHRLAVAVAAAVDRIPVQVGIVHIDGLSKLYTYRDYR